MRTRRRDPCASSPVGGGSIVDDYLDGYPTAVAERMGGARIARSHPVGDLRLSGRVRPLAGCTSLAVEIEKGGWLHRLVLPGPAASADSAAPRLESVPRPGRRAGGEPRTIEFERPLKLAAEQLVALRGAEPRRPPDACSSTVRSCSASTWKPSRPMDAGLRLELRGEGARARAPEGLARHPLRGRPQRRSVDVCPRTATSCSATTPRTPATAATGTGPTWPGRTPKERAPLGARQPAPAAAAQFRPSSTRPPTPSATAPRTATTVSSSATSGANATSS